jgi:hypothetical protein
MPYEEREEQAREERVCVVAISDAAAVRMSIRVSKN